MKPQTLSAVIAYALFFGFFIWYHFFFSPKIGASIASGEGKDHKRWNFYIWAFGVFAIFYLLVTLNDIGRQEKQTLILLICGYICMFIGAIGLDALFWRS